MKEDSTIYGQTGSGMSFETKASIARNRNLQSILLEMEEKYNNAYDKKLFGENTGYYLAGLDTAMSILKCYISAEQAFLLTRPQTKEDEPAGKCRAIDLAKYILNFCAKRKHPITNAQLQKMLYCIWKDFAKYDDDKIPLFSDDFIAWKFGPTIPEVYFIYSGYGGAEIHWSSFRSIELNLTEEEQLLLDSCICKYSNFCTVDFIKLFHKKGGAWDQIFDEGRGTDKIIPKDLIKEEAITEKEENLSQENTMRRI